MDRIDKKDKLIEKLKSLNIPFVFNSQKYEIKNLKYIIVGDNPGKKECNEKKYFIGPSGQILRNHFKKFHIVTDFDNECIVFNKTFIYTEKTKELKNIDKEILNETQDYCATEISKLSNEKQIPILIFGKSNICKGELFEKFWTRLFKEVIDKKNILVFSHPSYGNFSKEWKKIDKEGITFQNDNEKLIKIGVRNLTTIIKDPRCAKFVTLTIKKIDCK